MPRLDQDHATPALLMFCAAKSAPDCRQKRRRNHAKRENSLGYQCWPSRGGRRARAAPSSRRRRRPRTAATTRRSAAMTGAPQRPRASRSAPRDLRPVRSAVSTSPPGWPRACASPRGRAPRRTSRIGCTSPRTAPAARSAARRSAAATAAPLPRSRMAGLRARDRRGALSADAGVAGSVASRSASTSPAPRAARDADPGLRVGRRLRRRRLLRTLGPARGDAGLGADAGGLPAGAGMYASMLGMGWRACPRRERPSTPASTRARSGRPGGRRDRRAGRAAP